MTLPIWIRPSWKYNNNNNNNHLTQPDGTQLTGHITRDTASSTT